MAILPLYCLSQHFPGRGRRLHLGGRVDQRQVVIGHRRAADAVVRRESGKRLLRRGKLEQRPLADNVQLGTNDRMGIGN